MECKKCETKLNNNDKLCEKCVKKLNISNDSEKDIVIDKRKKRINIIFKILLIYIFVNLFYGKPITIFQAIILISVIICILKTEQRKNYIFLILGIMGMVYAFGVPIMIINVELIFAFLLYVLGFMKGMSLFDIIIQSPRIIFQMEGFVLFLIELSIISVIFIIIHKKQKFKRK